MNTITLFHGSPSQVVHPTFGQGDEKHDYGKGFYLTEDSELAKEWSVSIPSTEKGYVHQFELDTTDLKILDFQKINTLAWLAELMKHRDASDSKRYRMLARRFIDTYGVDTSGYDVIKGWRADASYFFIAKAFVRDEVDVSILDELLKLGNLGTQYCLRSEKAFQHLKPIPENLETVDAEIYSSKYDQRDTQARIDMKNLIDSDRNEVINVFSSLVGR